MIARYEADKLIAKLLRRFVDEIWKGRRQLEDDPERR